MRFVFLMQARLGSTRFPGKMLEDIRPGTTLLETVYNRVLLAKEATPDNVFVVTSVSSKDDKLVELMENKGIKYSRGDEENVYKRFYDFLFSYEPKPDYVIRVCADNPFLEPEFVDEITDYLKNASQPTADYVTYMDSSGRSSMGTQYGFFVEAIKCEAYMRANELGLTEIEKEHVTPQFYKEDNRPLQFSTHFLPMPKLIDMVPYRFTIDNADDFHVVRTVAKELPEKFSYREVVGVAQKYPELLNMMAVAVSGDKKAGR